MAPQSADSVQAREFAAYTLEYKKGTEKPIFLTLPVNPQSVSVNEPVRSNVQQTLGGQYVEEWGFGLKTINLEGHTGFSVKPNVLLGKEDKAGELDGYQAFVALVEIMRAYMKTAQEAALSKGPNGGIMAGGLPGIGGALGAAIASLIPGLGAEAPQELILHMWEEDEHWQVVPNGNEALRRSRNSQQPLLFSYNVSLLCVKEVKDSDGLKKLRDRLIAPPQAADLFSNLFGAFPVLNDIASFLSNSVNVFTDSVNAIKQHVDLIKSTYDGIVKGVQRAVSPLTDAIKKAAKACRALARSVQAVVRDVATAIRFTRTLVDMWCNLKHLGRHVDRYFKGLFSPISREWAALQGSLKRC